VFAGSLRVSHARSRESPLRIGESITVQFLLAIITRSVMATLKSRQLLIRRSLLEYSSRRRQLASLVTSWQTAVQRPCRLRSMPSPKLYHQRIHDSSPVPVPSAEPVPQLESRVEPIRSQTPVNYAQHQDGRESLPFVVRISGLWRQSQEPDRVVVRTGQSVATVRGKVRRESDGLGDRGSSGGLGLFEKS